MNPKYDIDVQLTGEDSNAFYLIGAVEKALRKNGVDKSEREEFRSEAMSGDYDNVIQTCMRWVNVH